MGEKLSRDRDSKPTAGRRPHWLEKRVLRHRAKPVPGGEGWRLTGALKGVKLGLPSLNLRGMGDVQDGDLARRLKLSGEAQAERGRRHLLRRVPLARCVGSRRERRLVSSWRLARVARSERCRLDSRPGRDAFWPEGPHPRVWRAPRALVCARMTQTAFDDKTREQDFSRVFTRFRGSDPRSLILLRRYEIQSGFFAEKRGRYHS